MKSIYFSNKKSLQIVSPNIRDDIKYKINEIGSFNLNSKYYTFLNKKNVNNLKENNFLVSLSTFGKKFILFMTRYNSKKYCIFINKKNDTMIVTQLKFSDDIFMGTLFDGELVKNNNDKWIYLINDIAYYKGENIITKPFVDRQKIIENIINNEQENDEVDSLYISNKLYFEYKYIKDLSDSFVKELNYKCSGLYFKSINNFSDNYLFIFPECRSDSKILNNTNKNDIKINIDNENNDLFEDVDIIDINNNNNNTYESNNKVYELNNKVYESNNKVYESNNKVYESNNKVYESNNKNMNENKHYIKNEKTMNLKLEKTTCRFLINTTIMPDIYELYCRNTNNNIEKHSYASVPDMDTSNLIKNIIGNNYNSNEDINTIIENGKAIHVECNYHKGFKKWIPFKKVDSMDTINVINQIQIILDSL
jgi:hypothetical protein